MEKPDAEEEIKRLKDEAEDYKGKLEMVAQMNLDRKRRELCAPDSIKTPEELMAYEKGLKNSGNSPPSGSAPLNVYQLGQGKLGFETLEQMIQHLYDNPTPENQEILRQLWTKTLKGTSQKKSFETQYPLEDPVTSNASEVEVSIFAPKDPNIESDKEKYDKVLRKNKKKNNGEDD